MAGLLITFEGGEGSGKSTQVARSAARLRARGVEPVLTREPGGTPLAEAVRAVLLDPKLEPSAVVEALLVETARADLVDKVIRPSLAAGRVVLCDRFVDSTLAYQGGGRGLDRAMLEAWNRAATGGLNPDLTILFDLDPAIGLARRAAEPSASGSPADGTNRLDREPVDFHQRVRVCFLELARREPGRFVVVDAAAAPGQVETHAWAAIEARLTGLGVPSGSHGTL
jgi:dTMP kinase